MNGQIESHLNSSGIGMLEKFEVGLKPSEPQIVPKFEVSTFTDFTTKSCRKATVKAYFHALGAIAGIFNGVVDQTIGENAEVRASFDKIIFIDLIAGV